MKFEIRIRELLEIDDLSLQRTLAELQDARVVLRTGTGVGARYRIAHALLRDAAYESLLHSDRRGLHGMIATQLLAEPARAEPVAIAHHLDGADRHAEAWRCCEAPVSSRAAAPPTGRRPSTTGMRCARSRERGRTTPARSSSSPGR
ncbi:MAG: hypothetical protein FJZ92_05450 [Chloroflexi bacterium]|nr:hypothetical protein [Chloroflexota bacterium]